MLASISLFFPLIHSIEVCSDLEYWNQCNQKCKSSLENCVNKCSSLGCEHDCSLENVSCMETCPCMKDCPNGCDGQCLHQLCVCGVPEENLDFIRCFEDVTALFEECFLDCANQECLLGCKHIYESNLNQCPCQPGCPGGCPCPHYNCPETTRPPTTTTVTMTTTSKITTSTITTTVSKTKSTTTTTTTTTSTITSPPIPSIVVLNTWKASSKPFLLQPSGNMNTNVNFFFSAKTEVYQSCSLTFQGEMYVFGGKSESTQISKVEGCRLNADRRSLPFSMNYGGCANVNDEWIALCFDQSRGQDCRKTVSSIHDWTRLDRSLLTHERTRIAASTDNIIAVGSHYHTHAELYDVNWGQWTQIPDYPFGTTINQAPIVAVNQPTEKFIIFGGYDKNAGRPRGTISEFVVNQNQWNVIGDLITGRQGHGAICRDGSFWIVGGDPAAAIESCQYKDDGTMACVQHGNTISGYLFYPEMFLVDNKFCLV